MININGNAVEWVREDSANLVNYAIDDLSEQADGTNKLFELQHQHIVGVNKFSQDVIELMDSDLEAVAVYVDGIKVPIIELNPQEGLITLSNPPEDGALVKVAYYWLNLAPVGAYGIEVVSENTFMVDPLIYKAPFRVNVSAAKLAKLYLGLPIALSAFDDIEVLVDGVVVPSSKFSIDETTRTLTFLNKLQGEDLQLSLSGSPTVLQAGTDYFLVKRRSNEVLARKTSGTEKILDLEFDDIVPGTLEIWFDDEKVSNQADQKTDKFSQDKITFTLVDGYKVTFSKSLPASIRVTASYLYRDPQVRDIIPIDEIFDDSFRVMLPDANIIPKSVDVWVKQDLMSHEDFTFDTETNDLVFYEPIAEDVDLRVSYFYSLASQGPYTFEAYGANNEAVAGCVLSFAKQAEVGGKQLVIISEKAEPTAEEYGGKFNVTFTLDVVALDPIQQEEITDLTAMYLLALKDQFDAEGLFLNEVSIQGESEQPYDENTTDQYYMASVSVSFMTDWHIRKAIPIKIRDTYVRLVASVYTEAADPRIFVTPTLYPVVEHPLLRSERIT